MARRTRAAREINPVRPFLSLAVEVPQAWLGGEGWIPDPPMLFCLTPWAVRHTLTVFELFLANPPLSMETVMNPQGTVSAHRSAALILASFGAVGLGCQLEIPGANTDKEVTVTFREYSVGNDDCDATVIPPSDYGDFVIELSVLKLPGEAALLTISTSKELGAPVIGNPIPTYDFGDVGNSVTFTLSQGEGFEIRGTIQEDDSGQVFESTPAPWSPSQILNFDDLNVGTQTVTLSSGPGCFSDDTIQVRVEVAEVQG